MAAARISYSKGFAAPPLRSGMRVPYSENGTGTGGFTRGPGYDNAPPPVTPLPVDPQYDATIAGLQRRRDTTLAGVAQQRTALSVNFDPNNPFSQVALAKRRFDEERRGNTNGMAARGHLYSGALQNAQDNTNFRDLQSQDALAKQYAAFFARTAADRENATTSYDIDAGQAYGDRIGRIPANPLYQPITTQPTVTVPSAKKKTVKKRNGR